MVMRGPLAVPNMHYLVPKHLKEPILQSITTKECSTIGPGGEVKPVTIALDNDAAITDVDKEVSRDTSDNRCLGETGVSSFQHLPQHAFNRTLETIRLLWLISLDNTLVSGEALGGSYFVASHEKDPPGSHEHDPQYRYQLELSKSPPWDFFEECIDGSAILPAIR